MKTDSFYRTLLMHHEFSDMIKVKEPREWEVKYVKLTDDIGYYIADQPFKDGGFDLYMDLAATFPIMTDTNRGDCRDPNPFATIHLPHWCCVEVFRLMRGYFRTWFDNKPIEDLMLTEWGNLYFKEESFPWNYFRLPHVDGPQGLVSNLWFTTNPDSGTKLYKYHGDIIQGDDNKLYYDFMVNEDHKLFKEVKHMCTHMERLDGWKNLSADEERHYGFECVGIAPCKKGTMTLYDTEVSHTPYIEDTCDFRWSHAYRVSERYGW